MPGKNRRSDRAKGDDEKLRPAAFARDAEEAEEYVELLSDHDIQAVLGSEEDMEEDAATTACLPGRRGIPVLVPEELLEEAVEVIADRDKLGFPLEADEDEEEEEEEETEEYETPEADIEGDLEENELLADDEDDDLGLGAEPGADEEEQEDEEHEYRGGW